MLDYDEVRLIGLVGKAGSGKDTLADEMGKNGWEKVAFADSLKQMCIDYLGLSHDDAYTQDGKMRFNEMWGMTNRSILQKVGTDAMRNGFDKDVWVKILQIRIRKMLAEGRKVVITDCRFDNEAQMVEDMGGLVVEVMRDSQSQNLSSDEQRHASEQPVSRKYVSFTIDNNVDKALLGHLFDASLGGFMNRHSDIARMLSSVVEHDKVLHGRLATASMRDIRKFLNVDPDGFFVSGNALYLEWNGTGEYGECLIKMTDGGIIFEAHPSSGATIETSEFQFGDLDGWRRALDFIVQKCK